MLVAVPGLIHRPASGGSITVANLFDILATISEFESMTPPEKCSTSEADEKETQTAKRRK